MAEEQLFSRIMEHDSAAAKPVGSALCSEEEPVVRDMIVCFDRNGIARRAITVYIR